MTIIKYNHGWRMVTMLVILVLVSLSSQRWSLVSEYRRNNLSNDGISILKNGALPRLDTKVNFIFENKRQEVPPFWPNRQFEEYKRMHNRQAIVLDGNIRQRKFAVVSYYCPRRAGNILHNLFNNIAWAIIHNRTILVTYEGHEHHKSGSSFEYCQQTLRIAEWIAMYDDFASMIAQPVPVALNQSIQQHTVVIFPQIPDVMMSKNVFRTQWRDEPDSGGGKYHRYVRSLGDEAVRRATKLYQFDVNYLFGMFFREIFSIVVTPSVDYQLLKQAQDADAFTFALHSRHTVIGDDGSFITDETKCLEEILPKERSHNKCFVFLMSDRPNTVEKLIQWLELNNCTGIANEDLSPSAPVDITDEMGPNQGIGFIQDLALSSNARSGIIGDSGRSSFMLLAEIIEYDRRIDDWKRGRDSPDSIPRCQLPSRFGRLGYNYGPGTPTFIGERTHEPMEPMQAFNQYKKHHSVEGVKLEYLADAAIPNRLFAIGHIPCPLNDLSDQVHAFLNDVLLAILTNRTLLWKYVDDTLCREQPVRHCEEKNTSTNCSDNSFFELQNWTLNYDEWSRIIELPEATYVRNNNYSMAEIPPTERVVVFPYNPLPIEDFSQFDPAHINESVRDMLFSNGTDFLFGMLFYEFFLFSDEVLIPAVGKTRLFDPSMLSLTLYIEDTMWDDDKMNCLENIILEDTRPCQIYTIADIDMTGHRESSLLDRCSFISLPLSQASVDKDLNFFRQLHFASNNGPSGFVRIGPASAKANFIRERIEYLRRHEAWRLGRIPPNLPDLLTCP